MIRVLHVLGGLGSGGTEALIMNWFRNIDSSKIQFDFLVRNKDDNYLKEIENLGGKVYYTSEFPKHAIKNYYETDRILRMKKWDVIHIHANAAIYILPLLLGYKYKYSKVIMHSHSVSAQRRIYSLIHMINKKCINKYSNIRIACSDNAGRWMFSEVANYNVLKNAIDISRFAFSESKRDYVRNSYGIDDCFVVGHVGRFSKPKNHIQMLNIFLEFKKQHSDAVLMLVGDGELEERIRNLAREMNIEEAVIFAGRQKDVGAYLSAMDLFLFPSLWEGMPLSLIEAQINGLPCIANKKIITKEIEDCESLIGVEISCTSMEWANKMNQFYNKNNNRIMSVNEADFDEYNIDNIIDKLSEFYLS